MRSLLSELSHAFSTTYSGWIIWNLFLAFVPLILSVFLFRQKAIGRRWLWWVSGFVGLTGVIGFWPKVPHLKIDWVGVIHSVLAGDRTAMLKVVWFLTLLTIAFIMGWGLARYQRRAQGWLWWIGFLVFLAFLPNAPYVLTDIIHLINATSHGHLQVWSVVLVFIPLHVTAIILAFEAYVLALMNQGYYLKQQGMPKFILPAELLMHTLSAVGIYLGRFLRLNSWDLVTHPENVFLITLNILTSRWPMTVTLVTFVIVTVLYWLLKQVTLGLKLRIRYAHLGVELLD